MLSAVILVIALVNQVYGLDRCLGDTRPGLTDEDFGKCNHDSTHRVCAVIGDSGSSFWSWTGQTSWCGSAYEEGNSGWMGLTRCPPEEPTWCICKWATEKWINGVGCDNADIDCGATDVCDLKISYVDFDVKLHVARECIASKCPTEWEACPDAAV